MADPIDVDKVKITAVKSADPHVLLTVDTAGSGLLAGDQINASVVFLNAGGTFIPSENVCIAIVSGKVEYEFSLKVERFNQMNTLLPGYAFLTVSNQDENQLLLSVSTIAVYPYTSGGEKGGKAEPLYSSPPYKIPEDEDC